MSEQDANKILRNRYGEVPEETRRELAQDDQHAELAAACERRGIEAHDECYDCAVGPRGCPYDTEGAEDCPPNCKSLVLRRPLPAPELLEKLEGWLADDGSRAVAWETRVAFECCDQFGPFFWAQHPSIAALQLTDTARAQAALAACEKLEGMG